MTNWQALGYMIRAMEIQNYSEEQIQKMMMGMGYQFDMMTREEAEEVYDKWDKE